MQSAVFYAALVGVLVMALGIWDVDAAPADGGNTKYFQYANILKPGDYEFGYHRGNPLQYRAHYEQGTSGKNFRAKIKWGDSYEGYGESLWEYNHGNTQASYAH